MVNVISRNYSRVARPRMGENGRLEPIKHIEWAIISYFLYYSFIVQTIFPIDEFIVLLVAVQLPDILEAILYRFITIDPHTRRMYTHAPIFGVFFICIGVILNNHLVFIVGIGYVVHLIEDLFAGGSPIFLLGPFSDIFQLLIINRAKRLSFGEKIRRKVGYLWPENTNSDLAWFWFLQFFGSVFCAISFCILLMSI